MDVNASRRRGFAALAAAAVTVGLVFALAAPATAQTQENGFACRAEALNASLFEQPQLQPLIAGLIDTQCENDEGGLPGAGEGTLPSLLGVDGAYAITRINDRNLAPAYQEVTAASGVADARLDPNGSLLRVEAVEALSQAKCNNGQLEFSSSGHVAKLSIFGQDIPLNDGLSQLITGIDGITQVLVHIELNEEIRDGSNYTFRALHVTVPFEGELLEVVVGENQLRGLGDPCNDFTGTGPGPQTPDRPIVGLPYGGGNVVGLGDVAGFSDSACKRSRAFGRRIAIIGSNRGDTIVGSRFADRIFTFGGRDIISAGRARDCIEAGSGNDSVSGDAGGDTLYGRGGKDKLDGGLGPDLLLGGAGKDRLLSGNGKDRLVGGAGGDKISGRGGGDRISGGAGNDKIYADFRGNRDVVKCGPGRDKVQVDRYDRVSSDCEKVGVNLSGRVR